MSSRIPQHVIDDVLARVDLIELIDARIPLRKKSGSNYVACCPFHQEKTPSFSVNAARQFYHCFGCGAGGNALSFLMQHDHLDFMTALQMLAEQVGIALPDRSGQQVVKSDADLYDVSHHALCFYQKALRSSQRAIHYLKGRGISGITAKQFALGYAPETWDALLRARNAYTDTQLARAGLVSTRQSGGYVDRFRDRIMFPIQDTRGRVIGFGGRILDTGEPKYLNSPETPIFHKGHELYGLYQALQSDRKLKRLFVVEGYMDVITLAQSGITNVVATLGTAVTIHHLQRLLKHVSDIVFCFDGDAAGKRAAWRALEVTLPLLQDGLQVQFMFLPEGDDPDAVVRREGAAGLERHLAHAQNVGVFLLSALAADIDTGTMAGRARLATLVMPLIQQIPGIVFKQLLLEQLATYISVPVTQLSVLSVQQAGTQVSDSAVRLDTQTLTPMRLAIALLLQNPHLLSTLADPTPWQSLALPGTELLTQLMEAIGSRSDMTTGMLMAYWQDDVSVQTQMHRLAVFEHHVSEPMLAAEWHGALQRLLTQARDHAIEQRLHEAKIRPLSSEEKTELTQWLMARKEERLRYSENNK